MLSYAGFHRPTRHYAGEAAAVVAAEEKVERMERKAESDAVAAREMTAAAYNKGAAVLTSGAMGAYQGMRGKVPEVMGVGVDLIVGVAASAVGLLGHKIPKLKSQKRALEVIDGIGTGSLAFWAANQGNMWGLAKAQKSAATPATAAAKTAGYDGDPRQFAPHFDADSVVEDSTSSVPYGYR
jgi:hypothetical protein